MSKIKLHDEVIVKETREHAFVVWFNESPNEDSYLLEIKGKNEMPKFYSRNDFITLEEKNINSNKQRINSNNKVDINNDRS